MPCATIHLLLARRVLEEWENHPRRAPVPLDRGDTIEAFLHGSLAPDMGFVPGVDRLISELAHYLAPGDLSRHLVETAEDPVQRAFAWGWACHVQGDVEIHPLVGRAVGQRLHGDRSRRIDALEDVSTHVSLEVGLDVVFFTRRPEIPLPPSSSYLDRRRIRHLIGSLEVTYGVGWDPAELMRDHRRAVTLTRWWPRALAVLARGRRLGPPPAGGLSGRMAAPLLELLRLATPPGSAAEGFFAPEAPPPWVVEEVSGIAERFPRRFQELVDGGIRKMENRNLETGGRAGPGRGHPATDAAARKLERLRSS